MIKDIRDTVRKLIRDAIIELIREVVKILAEDIIIIKVAKDMLTVAVFYKANSEPYNNTPQK